MTEQALTHDRREIGRTGKSVFPIGLGGMPLSIQNRPSEAEAIRVIHASLEAGVDFIDTANVYCLDDSDIGHNEALIAKAIKQAKRPVFVATKGGLRRPKGDWTNDARPEFLRLSCEQSLRALGVDRIFLYQLHAPDPKIIFTDSVGALAALKTEGKIEHIGLSNVTIEQLRAALKVVRIESVQNRINPFDGRDYTNGMIEFCEKEGISFLPHSPVGGHTGHARLKSSGLFEKLEQKYGCSRYVVVLAWHLSKGARLIPIPGASKITSATDSPRAASIRLEPSDIALIDRGSF